MYVVLLMLLEAGPALLSLYQLFSLPPVEIYAFTGNVVRPVFIVGARERRRQIKAGKE